jgi:hypothetical protein
MSIRGFRPVPFTGVIFVMAEAGRNGYRYGHPDWCNLGQGQPETGPLPGSPRGSSRSRSDLPIRTTLQFLASGNCAAVIEGIGRIQAMVRELG